MNSKHMMMLSCAAAFCGGVLADDAKSAKTEEAPATLAWAPGEGVSFGEQPVLSAEVGLACDSKFMSYGLALTASF